MVQPILKWAGGKRQLLDDIKQYFPSQYNDYYEPFIGGGALFFELQPTNGHINDKNTRLINFYKTVRDNPQELIETAKNFKPPESDPDPNRRYNNTNRKGKNIKNYYYQQREIFNCRPNNEEFDPIEEAALLLYLNRTCYNGLYRENQSGEFNTPIGRYANPDWIREQQIKKASPVLSQIKINNKDFTYIENLCQQGDAVYLDSPYKPMSATASFTEYSADGFGKQDQKRLRDLVEKLDNKNVHVVVSNSGVMYDLYDNIGLQVETVSAKRSINSDETNRGNVEEILAHNSSP